MASRLRQYQPQATGFVPPPPFALDWLPTYPSLLRRARPLPLSAEAKPIFTEPVADVIMGWFPAYPDTLRRARTLLPPTHVVEGLVPIIPTLAWAPSYPTSLRRAVSYRRMESTFFTLTPAAFPASPLLAWAPTYPSSLPASWLDRLYIPWQGDENIDPIPTPPGTPVMIEYRQQRSWHRSSSG